MGETRAGAVAVSAAGEAVPSHPTPRTSITEATPINPVNSNFIIFAPLKTISRSSLLPVTRRSAVAVVHHGYNVLDLPRKALQG